jgi:hypothetical protein
MDPNLAYYKIPLCLFDSEIKSWILRYGTGYWLWGDDLLVGMPRLEGLIFRIKFSECLR